MFEKIYETRIDNNTGKRMQVRLSVEELQQRVDAERNKPNKEKQYNDLNLIYKSNTKTAFAAFRLNSFVSNRSGKNERVTKFLIEIGSYDANKPEGSRQNGYVQIYMDVNDFAYFCGKLRDGRVLDLFARGEKVPYIYHSGTSNAKVLRVYQGSKMPIILEATEGPGIKGNNGQTLPDDWNGKNKQNIKKNMIALSEEEASKIASAGLRAIQILDFWKSFGRDEENLALINVTMKRESSDRSQQGGYANRGAGNGAFQGAFNQQGGYTANGQAQQSGYVAGGQGGMQQTNPNQPVAPFLDPAQQTFGQSWV